MVDGSEVTRPFYCAIDSTWLKFICLNEQETLRKRVDHQRRPIESNFIFIYIVLYSLDIPGNFKFLLQVPKYEACFIYLSILYQTNYMIMKQQTGIIAQCIVSAFFVFVFVLFFVFSFPFFFHLNEHWT